MGEERKVNTGLVVLICVLFVVIIAMGVYILVDKTSQDKEITNNGGNINNNEIIDNVNKDNDVNNTTKVEYKEYKVGDEITLSDGSKWTVIKNSGTTEDYVTVLGQEDYYEQWNGGASLYNKLIEYKNSELDIFMQSQQSRIPAELKEVDGYKIRLITLDEIFAITSSWEQTSSDGYWSAYKYTKEDWNDVIPVGISTMTPITLPSVYEGSYLPFYKIISSECLGAECTKHYYVSRSDSGLGGFYPVVNIYKKSI